MRFVAGFTGLARAIAFHRHRQNHGGPLDLFTGRGVGRVDFVRIMSTAIEVHDVFVAEVFYQLQRLGVFPEEVFPGVGTAIELAVLQLAIADLIHDLLQVAALVAFDQRIPLSAPHDLDHVPSGTAEHAFQFLNNFAVTPDRAIQSLQVAVDHEVQIAETFTPRQRDGSKGFGLVTLSVAEKAPDLAIAVIHQTALALVLHHVGLVDRLNRSKAHRHRGELPVVRHQPWMWIRREALPAHFATEILELGLTDHPFKV